MRRSDVLFLRLVCLTALSLMVSGLTAQRADYSKLSSWLRSMAMEQAVGSRQQAAVRAGGGMPAVDGRMLTAFVRADGSMDSVFSVCSCRELARYGDLYVVALPVGNVPALSCHPSVRRIESRQGMRLCMDSTAVHLGAMPAYAGTGLPCAFTGKGVMVGVMDIGFDLTHPNFYDATASTYRIRSLWDQLSVDTVGSQHYVGASYHGRDALLAYGHSRDGLDQTHGTHTLGIAAGGGYGSPYRGMAWESDICIVANATTEDIDLIAPEDLYKYTYATDALGFKYIFDTADSLGMPCVISFSEGSGQDFRGDDQLFYAMLDSLTGPGHIIVSSAGNEGMVPTYIYKEQGRESAGTFVYSSSDRVAFTVNAQGDFDLRVVFYRGENRDTVCIRSSDILAAGDSLYADTVEIAASQLYVMAAGYDNCYDPERQAYEVVLRSMTRFSSLGAVSVEVVGRQADIELFRNIGAFLTDDRNPSLADAQATHCINSPSSAPCVICVGATSYRTEFVNYLGDTRKYDMGTNGQRGEYSSVGPTYDGRIKPDVMAPGTNVISSYSSFYLENHPTANDIKSDVEHFDFNGRTYAWNSNSGTSMSSPAVAGAIALWLQADPTLSPSDILGVLSRTCTRYDGTLQYPNNLYGYGQIDAYAGLLDILGLSAIREISSFAPQGVTVRPLAQHALELCFDRKPEKPVRVTVYTMAGVRVLTETFCPTSDAHRLSLPASVSGVAVVQVDEADGKPIGSVMVKVF